MTKKEIIKFALVPIALLLAVLLLNGISVRQSNAETEQVREAVKNAALACYAVEGAYPEELSYLQENYGLLYDSERYIIQYDAFAENLLPDIRVLERGRRDA